MKIAELVRKNIRDLKPYSSARDEFQGEDMIFLDANENPYGIYNRYPDPYQTKLKDLLSSIKNVPDENIFLGNGSDEIIDLLIRIFCEPRKDKILTLSPSYGMYSVLANINDTEIIELPLKNDFSVDLNQLRRAVNEEKPKLIFICSPNNPTGNSIDAKIIEYILGSTEAVLVIDEAYIDFSPKASWMDRIMTNERLVVMQTLSKSHGLAALRLGMAFSNSEIIRYLNKVKAPYNISSANQKVAFEILSRQKNNEQEIEQILREKERLKDALLANDLVVTVFPSDANFWLVEVKDAESLYKKLLDKKLVVRNRSSQIKNCLRITVGTPEENQRLINELKTLTNEESTVY